MQHVSSAAPSGGRSKATGTQVHFNMSRHTELADQISGTSGIRLQGTATALGKSNYSKSFRLCLRDIENSHLENVSAGGTILACGTSGTKYSVKSINVYVFYTYIYK